MALIDKYRRKIDYLRISITDRCNLNCRYCAPPFSDRKYLPHDQILTFEEITRVAEAAVSAGISRIRVTGGEPLVRTGVVDFFRMLGRIEGLKDLTLTTNGVKLSELAPSLFTAGVRRVNVSLDTLDRHRFGKLTGRDRLDEVLDGIQQAGAVGMAPIKLNTVVMRGVNDDEIPSLARLTFKTPHHIRFIELMPFTDTDNFRFEKVYMSVGEIIKKIPGIDRARIDRSLNGSGPARMCRLQGAKGKVGFIAPLSWHFCGNCNRLRLTADGKIRTCLFAENEIDVKTHLRKGATKQNLIALLRSAVAGKPKRHHLTASPSQKINTRGMYAIGG